MPYVQGGTSQGNSGAPEVQDVYHSPSVFANNVPIALWQTPGQSAAFAGIAADPAPRRVEKSIKILAGSLANALLKSSVLVK